MKRFILVLVLSCSFLLLFGSVSFAVPRIDWDGFNQISYSGNYYDFFNDLCITYYGVEFSDLQIATGTSVTNASNLLNDLSNNTYQWYQYRIVYYNSSGYNIYCDLYNSNGTGYKLLRIYKSSSSGKYLVAYEWRSGGSDVVFRSEINDNLGTNNYEVNKYIVNTQNTYNNNLFYKSMYNTTNPSLINLKFIPSSTTIKNIQGVNFYIYKFNRNFPYISIGQLFNLDNYNEVVGSLYMFTNSTNYDYFVTNTYNTIDGEQVQLFTNNLYYNQGYAVNFKYQDFETGYYYIYFLPSDTNISGDFSGDIVYGGNDNNTIVPIQNAINQQYNVNSGELLGIINNELFPSGDLSVISNTTGFDNYSNNYFDLLYNFYRNIITTLTSSGNVTLPLSYRNWSMTLNSSDFTIPDNPIKSLVCIILVVWCIYLIYQDLDKQYRHIREFNLFGFLHDTDVDYHMFL